MQVWLVEIFWCIRIWNSNPSGCWNCCWKCNCASTQVIVWKIFPLELDFGSIYRIGFYSYYNTLIVENVDLLDVKILIGFILSFKNSFWFTIGVKITKHLRTVNIVPKCYFDIKMRKTTKYTNIHFDFFSFLEMLLRQFCLMSIFAKYKKWPQTPIIVPNIINLDRITKVSITPPMPLKPKTVWQGSFYVLPAFAVTALLFLLVSHSYSVSVSYVLLFLCAADKYLLSDNSHKYQKLHAQHTWPEDAQDIEDTTTASTSGGSQQNKIYGSGK